MQQIYTKFDTFLHHLVCNAHFISICFTVGDVCVCVCGGGGGGVVNYLKSSAVSLECYLKEQQSHSSAYSTLLSVQSFSMCV